MSDRILSEEEVARSFGDAGPRGFPPAREVIAGVGLALEQGAAVGRESTTLVAELIRISLGRSEVDPSRDNRFRDPAWAEDPAFRRLAQSYLAGCRAANNLVSGLEEKSWAHAETARFLTTIATSAAAPTNVLAGNPAALKKAFDSGGTSLVRGMTNWLSDLQHNGGLPSMAKKGQFVLGEQLAATKGGVISRDPVAELIQYAATTEQVHSRPTLVVPPPIGRFYFLDLAPGRSFVEHSVSRGIQTFMLSWRNPTKKQADWGIDEYAERIIAAVDEIREVTGQEDINVIGFCAGGILTSVALNALTARGEKKVHSASYAVTLLDWAGNNPINVLKSQAVLKLAKLSSRRKGVIDARAMGSAFTWMRPDDLVWNYWVNNYLLGQDPPPFDILSWNADGTNLPAKLHTQLLDIFGKNPLTSKGRRTFLGASMDLASIEVPTFVVGAVKDHLTPWRGTYRTTELTGGDTTYVLSNAGHIAALVNPPTNPKASYFTGPDAGAVDAETWRRGAVEQKGSWWDAWADWTIERAGEELAAPESLGDDVHEVLSDAPGLYVRDELPA
jgi:polyhydroxyalkanoate synthase